MAFQVSPGVAVSEVDASTTIPTTAVSDAGFAGYFSKGPANKIVNISSENELVEVFGQPNNSNASDWLCVSSFLSYGGSIQIVRLVDENAVSAHSGTDTDNDVVVLNDEDWEAVKEDLDDTTIFVARTPGTWANQGGSAPNIEGISVYFLIQGHTDNSFPDISGDAYSCHIKVTLDGSEVERFEWVDIREAAVGLDGRKNYYKEVINTKSAYVFINDNNQANAPSNNDSANNLGNGADGSYSASRTSGYSGADSLFTDKEQVDLSLIVTGDVMTAGNGPSTLATERRDCVAFYSPNLDDINTSESQSTKAAAVITSGIDDGVGNDSFSFMDSGWKKMYDKYNDTWRFVPLNGDIAGLCVATDNTREPWYSPAGFNRGQIRNCAGLVFDPNKASRDSLYKKNINPVSSFPGQGFVLFGDKTRQAKPSAFDRINVRRLFIVLEKTISEAAKYSLFEFNDEFTRSQFTSLINPYLRDIKGRRGIHDYLVVCDDTNNTPTVVDANQFVGDIFIKPTRSINFIQLNFVAVRTGVSFSEVVGAV